MPQLVVRPPARRPDPRRPLRRRPLADRDGAAVPGTTLIGVEFEPDSVARARANVDAAVLTDRITIERGDVDGGRPRAASSTSPTSSTRSTSSPDAPAALRSAWEALGPDGWLVRSTGTCRPSPTSSAAATASCIAGVQLDELVQGTRLVTRNEALGWFAAAGIPTPELIDLPSGASAIVARR